jgi:hypothetical protein
LNRYYEKKSLPTDGVLTAFGNDGKKRGCWRFGIESKIQPIVHERTVDSVFWATERAKTSSMAEKPFLPQTKHHHKTAHMTWVEENGMLRANFH